MVAVRLLKKKHQWKPTGLENGLMGFYALLTSFTLVQSGSHANDRDIMIHSIADDMSEVLRISATNEPELNARVRTHFSDLYKIIREPLGTGDNWVAVQVKRVDRLDDSLDRDMQLFIRQNPPSRDRVSSLLAKIDRIESHYYHLMHSYNKTVPGIVLFILVLFSMFIGFIIGFVDKYNGNHIHIVSIVFVIISFIILNVIHDLDNPLIGYIQPDYRSIDEVIQSFHIPV